MSVLAVTFALNATSALAYVLPPPPPPPTNPPKQGPHPEFGFLVPYITGRVGSDEQLPVGEVVPDDFCIEDKAESCGDHLRDQDPSPFASGADLAARGTGGDNWGFWAQAGMRQTTWANIGREVSTSSMSIGVDRALNDYVAFGLMAMILQEETTLSGAGPIDRADGVLAGPYFLVQSGGSISLDGRFLFGAARHEVTTGGVRTGQYTSQRTMFALRASTEVERENWLIYPSFEVANLTRRSDAYVDAVAGNVPAATTNETFLTVGGLGYYQGLADGTSSLQPYAGLYGHFDVTNGNVFGSARIGVLQSLDNGGALYLEYIHGAIGLSGVTDGQISAGIELSF